MTTFIHDIHLYVPRHSRVTFVQELDFLSGLGNHPARTHGAGPRYLITDLGQFDFNGSDGCMRLISRHPGVPIERIQLKTGFEVQIPREVEETPPPSSEELRLLREEIDPHGIRRLELLSGAERRKLLRQIIAEETAD